MKTLIILILLATSTIAWSQFTFYPAKNDAIILIGYSNASGRGVYSDTLLVPINTRPNGQIWSIDNQRFEQIDYPSGNNQQFDTEAGVGKFGMELSLMQHLYNYTGREHKLIKIARGSTNLYQHWNPDSSGFAWLKLKEEYLKISDSINQVGAIIFNCGTLEARATSAIANAYFDYFTVLRDSIKALPKLSNVEIIIYKIAPPNAAANPYLSTVRAKQQLICDTYADCICIESELYLYQSDQQHYNGISLYRQGIDIVNERLIKILSNNGKILKQ